MSDAEKIEYELNKLRFENAILKKKVAELYKETVLNKSEIVNYRRQIEFLIGHDNPDV